MRPFVFASVALLYACGSSAPRSARPEPEPAPRTLACTLVLLKTGPRPPTLSDDERAAVFRGHFANMQRLARGRQLLVAGPFGEERSDPGLRGVFILDTGDRAEAERLAETDPGVQAGIFAPEYHALEATAPLRAYLAEELAADDAAAAAGKTRAPGDGGRAYVLLRARDGARALAALAGHPDVIFSASLDGDGALALLDAVNPAAAHVRLAPLADRLGAITLDGWFGSGLLTRVRP